MPRTQRSRPQRLITCDGVFDVPAARRLEQTLANAPAGEALRVDLTRVSEFHDFGLAVLAQALKHEVVARIVLLGLRKHQIRMLRYFGVDASRYGLPRAAEST